MSTDPWTHEYLMAKARREKIGPAGHPEKAHLRATDGRCLWCGEKIVEPQSPRGIGGTIARLIEQDDQV